jgi:predicted ester cyclase
VLVEAGAAFPDASEEIISSTFDGETLIVRAQFRGTFSAAYYGVSPHFGPLSWQIVDHWHLERGRIVKIAFAADTAEAWRQLRPSDR